MFKAGSDFKNKTTEEIFYSDFKIFHTDEFDFGVAQISAMSRDLQGSCLHHVPQKSPWKTLLKYLSASHRPCRFASHPERKSDSFIENRNE